MASNDNTIDLKGNDLYIIQRIFNRQKSSDRFTKQSLIDLRLTEVYIAHLEDTGLIHYPNGYVFITELAERSLLKKENKERQIIYEQIYNDYEYALLQFLYNRDEPVNILSFPPEFEALSKIHMKSVDGSDHLFYSWTDEVSKYLTRSGNGYILSSGGKKYFEKRKAEKELAAQKEIQENQIRQLDIMIKVDQVVDYPTVKRQRRNAYIFAATSVLIAIIAMIIAYLQYLKCK